MSSTPAEHFANQWIDYLDSAENSRQTIDNTLMRLKELCSEPWSHPNQNMRWLWDYCLMRKAELVAIYE
jgi:hypothetical protein